MIELNDILSGIIDQVPVIAVLVWIIIEYRTDRNVWREKYFEMERRLFDQQQSQYNSVHEELRTVSALNRQRSEYDMRVWEGFFGVEKPIRNKDTEK